MKCRSNFSFLQILQKITLIIEKSFWQWQKASQKAFCELTSISVQLTFLEYYIPENIALIPKLSATYCQVYGKIPVHSPGNYKWYSEKVSDGSGKFNINKESYWKRRKASKKAGCKLTQMSVQLSLLESYILENVQKSSKVACIPSFL